MLQRPQSLKPLKGIKQLSPNFIAESIMDIDFEYLLTHGVKAGLIDLDGTVVARGMYDVDPKIVTALKNQPLKIYIATNRPKGRGLKNLKEQLNANGVIHPIGIWGKPFPKYYAQAASEHGLDPKELVMIGDRYLQDIFGANLAGLRTILVKKIDKPTNMFDRLLSGTERRQTEKLAGRYEPISK